MPFQDNINIREFKTEFRSKKRKRRDAFLVLNDEQQWLSFSSGNEDYPNQKGDTRHP